MISVTDQANNANGSPGEQIALGVANRTPQTSITRDKTWNVVNITLLGTMPVAACTIFNEKINFIRYFRCFPLINHICEQKTSKTAAF